ncbi:hypothetical protein F4677DRAFT_130932 [Hypoxylon crocopeplum]|nr:hypothetical protein F4677DRAFT_130932 [Hypoxylon crocopeplum]
MDNPSSSFPQFKQFPPEIRMMIWEAALQEIEPGLCIPRFKDDDENGIKIEDSSAEKDRDKLPLLLVNCGLSPIFHACSESREVARKTVAHREDNSGACFGASREYDPDEDVLFMSPKFYRLFPMRDWKQAAEVRHVALEHPDKPLRFRSVLWTFYDVPCFPGLRKLSIVETSGVNIYHEPTGRRFQLRGYIPRNNWDTTGEELSRWRGILSHRILKAKPADLEATLARLARCGSEPDD